VQLQKKNASQIAASESFDLAMLLVIDQFFLVMLFQQSLVSRSPLRRGCETAERWCQGA
jgi:hypothetical protein